MVSDSPQHISFDEANNGIVCVADACGVLSNNVQHRLSVGELWQSRQGFHSSPSAAPEIPEFLK